MKKITLANDFHNTEATVIPQLITEGRNKGYYRISRATAHKLHDKLCGSANCTCGDTFGARGIQPGDTAMQLVNEDTDRNYIVDLIKK